MKKLMVVKSFVACTAVVCGFVADANGVAFSDGEGDVKFDLAYLSDGDAETVGDLYLPARCDVCAPVVVTVHGGGWVSGDGRETMQGVAEFFCQDLGFAVFNVDYRYVTRDRPWPSCAGDCMAAAEYVLSSEFTELCGLTPKQVIFCGYSSGGHLSLWAGLALPSEQVAGIISISGVGDTSVRDPSIDDIPFVELFRGLPGAGDNAEGMNVLGLVRPNGPRILLMHSTEDDVVPLMSARNLEAAYLAEGNDCEFFEYSRRAVGAKSGHAPWDRHRPGRRLLGPLERRIAQFVGVQYESCRGKSQVLVACGRGCENMGRTKGTNFYCQGGVAFVRAVPNEGYVFAGWYEDADCRIPVDFSKLRVGKFGIWLTNLFKSNDYLKPKHLLIVRNHIRLYAKFVRADGGAFPE